MINIGNIHYETCLCILRNKNISNDVKLYQILDMVEQGVCSVKNALFLLYKYKVIDRQYEHIESEHNQNYLKYYKILSKTTRTCQRCNKESTHTVDIERLDIPYTILCEDCWSEVINEYNLEL